MQSLYCKILRWLIMILIKIFPTLSFHRHSKDTYRGQILRSNLSMTSLHHSSFSRQDSVLGSMGSPTELSSSETWRTETFLQAIMEFWFSQNSLVPKEFGLRQQVQVCIKDNFYKFIQNISKSYIRIVLL